jgi:hypothetical protein
MGELPVRHCNEMVAETTRQMLNLPSHSDFAGDERNRRRPDIKLATDAVRNPEYRYDCAFSKGHRLVQSAEAGCDPFALGCEKAQALPRRDATRQDQFNPALGGIDAQRHPPRPRADPNRQRGTEIERRHVTLEILESQCRIPGRNSPKIKAATRYREARAGDIDSAPHSPRRAEHICG